MKFNREIAKYIVKIANDMNLLQRLIHKISKNSVIPQNYNPNLEKIILEHEGKTYVTVPIQILSKEGKFYELGAAVSVEGKIKEEKIERVKMYDGGEMKLYGYVKDLNKDYVEIIPCDHDCKVREIDLILGNEKNTVNGVSAGIITITNLANFLNVGDTTLFQANAIKTLLDAIEKAGRKIGIDLRREKNSIVIQSVIRKYHENLDEWYEMFEEFERGELRLTEFIMQSHKVMNDLNTLTLCENYEKIERFDEGKVVVEKAVPFLIEVESLDLVKMISYFNRIFNLKYDQDLEIKMAKKGIFTYRNALEKELEYAERNAKEGDVVEAELSLKEAREYAEKIGEKIDNTLVEKIMNIAYRNGIEKELEYAERNAKEGDVVGVELSLKEAREYAEKIGISIDNNKFKEIMDIAYKNRCGTKDALRHVKRLERISTREQHKEIFRKAKFDGGIFFDEIYNSMKKHLEIAEFCAEVGDYETTLYLRNARELAEIIGKNIDEECKGIFLTAMFDGGIFFDEEPKGGRIGDIIIKECMGDYLK